MGSEFSTYAFSDLLSNIVDNRGRTCPIADSGLPLIATNCVKNDTLYPSFERVRYVDDETYESWFRGHPESGDMIFVCKGSPGNVCWTPDPVNFCIAQDMVAIRANENLIDSKFLFALLRYPGTQAQILNMHVGTMIPHFKKGDFKNLFLKVPTDKAVQKAVGEIYFAFCRKIELNRRMNETLESMARALFKSWFVDYDPVIDNALAAGNPIPEPLHARAETGRALGTARKPLPKNIQKLFPNSFAFTEEMGWIPTGWEIGPILNRAALLSGGTPKTSVEAYWNGETKWASAKDVSQCGNAFLVETDRMITTEGLNNSSTKMIPRFSTVIVSRGATTGRLTMFGDDIAMNQTCYALRSHETDHYFLYCHARHFIGTLVNSAHGSVFDTITTRTFESTIVLLPPTTISEAFNDIVELNFERILLALRESHDLAKLRDTLLPKLLSGELRILDAEKLVASSL